MFNTVTNNYPRLTIFPILNVEMLKESPLKLEEKKVIVITAMLSHYLNDEYIDKVIKVLDRLNTDDYYAQMGVAWAVATIMGKYPEKCMNYLKSKNCNLDKITYNKSFRQIT